MKNCYYILICLFIFSCTTSNTMYKAPENLIPKDSMVSLLTDLYIASAAKNYKNNLLKKEKNYVFLVYEKYKIDSTRFNSSNLYYTSKIEEYTVMLNEIKSNIDSLDSFYKRKRSIQDSIKRKTKKPIKNLLIEKNDKLLKLKSKRTKK